MVDTYGRRLNFPTGRYASMNRRRVLIIAFHYPPIQGSSGVHRSLAFSKYLHDFGWDATVLTVIPRAHEQAHAGNMRMVPEHVRVIEAQAWDSARHFSIKGRYPLFLALPDRWSSWIPFGTRAGRAAIKAEQIDAIFSTFPIASAHVIARNLHRASNLPWIADFRDPMATPTYPHDRKLRDLWTSIQNDVIREASCITVTTPGAAAFYRRMYGGLPENRIAVIENGFDPEAFTELDASGSPVEHAPLTLLHSGILYPRERDPGPFFRALRTLKFEGTVSSSVLRVVLRASGFEDKFAAMVEQLEITDLVQFAGALPYREALKEMLAASALLLFQAKVCNDQIPAKAYEYLYARRPILGLTDPAGDTGQLLKRFAVPGVTALEDESGITQMLRSALRLIRRGEYRVPQLDEVMSVSRRAGAAQLAEVLDRAVTSG